MSTPAQKRASAKYTKNNIKSLQFGLNKKTDADIIAFMATLPNKSGYFKNLVRTDMKRRQEEQENEQARSEAE